MITYTNQAVWVSLEMVKSQSFVGASHLILVVCGSLGSFYFEAFLEIFNSRLSKKIKLSSLEEKLFEKHFSPYTLFQENCNVIW